MKQNESALLRAAQRGDAAAFARLYSLYVGQLYRYALKYLGNSFDAEDAVSESTLRVFRSIGNVRNAEAFKAYYFRTLSNCAKTILRTKAKRSESFTEFFCARTEENVELEAEVRADVGAALKTLNAKDLEIVLLSAVGGFSSREIAGMTGYTAGSVRSRLSRALGKLRKAMGGEWQPQEQTQKGMVI